ncbi:MAG: Tim44/TimA family putative adaptor protein [Pseudomonadota bacterium]
MDPVSLILAGVAIFFVYKLISVLGTRTGHEQKPEIEGLQRPSPKAESDAQAAANASAMEESASSRRTSLSAEAKVLREADENFDEASFLDGAKAAYEMIVEAFASGDLKSVKGFLAPTVFEAFSGAVSARQAEGSRLELKFVGIGEAVISAARIEKGEMLATVQFSSDQVRTTYASDDSVVDGHPNRVDLVKDSWTFSKKLKSTDPNWTLVATGASS